jgi:heme/copper-type cytochrome/quinol oxidase subunit 2
MELSTEADREKERAQALQQTKILIYISAFVLILTFIVIGIILYIVANTRRPATLNLGNAEATLLSLVSVVRCLRCNEGNETK